MVVADIINAAVSGTGRALAWLAEPRAERTRDRWQALGEYRKALAYRGELGYGPPSAIEDARLRREAGLPAKPERGAA